MTTQLPGGPVGDRRGSRLARVVSLPIRGYSQVSRLLPARCRFYPTCSSYALEALRVHGAARGSLLAVRRILRCHPFHPGGHDPVPPRRSTIRADRSRRAGRNGIDDDGDRTDDLTAGCLADLPADVTDARTDPRRPPGALRV